MGPAEQIELVRPHGRYRDSYLAGLSELADESEKNAWVYLGDLSLLDFPQRDFGAYVQTLLQREFVPPAHFARDLIYWATYRGEIVGRISLRLELNDFLRRIGGHIGYIVRPRFRRQGVATEMLRRMLLTPEAQEIGRLLLTCDEPNLASEKTILRCGGVLEGLVEIGPGLPKKKRYWIDLHRA